MRMGKAATSREIRKEKRAFVVENCCGKCEKIAGTSW
jgi:hypothetical protein